MNTKDKLKELSAASRDAYEASLSATRATYDAKEVARSIFDDTETITHEPSKAYTTAAYDAAWSAHNAAWSVYYAARTAYNAARTAQGAAYEALDAAKNLNN